MSHRPKIHFPTEEENKAALDRFVFRMKSEQRERRAAIELARPALQRLADALKENHNTGQPYKIREILFSLWNGKPGSLVEIVCLDWELKKDLCAIILAFGSCPAKGEEFFYQALQNELERVGLMDWFREESENTGKMREWLHDTKDKS